MSVTSKKFSDVISFSRNDATSCATFVGSDGRMGVMSANYIKQSELLSDAIWLKAVSGTGSAPVVTSGFNAPDGSATAWRVQLNKGAGTTSADFSQLAANNDVSSGNGIACVWMKSNTASNYNVFFGNAAGSIVSVTPTWTKFTTGTTETLLRIFLRGTYSTDNAADILVWHPQFEVGATTVGTYSACGATAPSSGQRFDYDPSQMLISGTTGVELAPAFTSANWTQASGWSVSNGMYVQNGTSAGNYGNTTSSRVVAGKTYLCVYTIFAITTAGNGFSVVLGNTAGAVRTAIGTYSEYITAANSGYISMTARGSGAWAGTVSAISVQEVTYATTGVEYVVNGNFASGSTGWNLTSGSPTIAVGSATLNANGDTISQQTTTVTLGKTYKISFDITQSNSGNLVVFAGANALYDNFPGVGNVTVYVRASATNVIRFNSQGFIGKVTNISVQEMVFTPRGLLVEESRSNGCTYSGTMYDANWASFGSVTAAVSTVPSPDGINMAATLTFTGSGSRYKSCAPTVTTLAPWTFSVYVKYVSGAANTTVICASQSAFGGTGGDRIVVFNAQTGAFLSSSTEIGTNYTITNAGNGWWRVSGTYTPTTASVTTNVGVSNGLTSTVLVWGAQLELGSFPTSYIPTTINVPVIRQNDIVQLLSTNFGPWYNQTQGTFIAEVYYTLPSATTSPQTALIASDGSSTNRVYLRRNNTTGISDSNVVAANVFQSITGPSVSMTQNNIAKLAIAYQAASSTVAINGTSGTPSGAVSIPSTLTQLDIGGGFGATYINGWIRRIQYFPTKLSDTQIQTLTL